jgi:leader peptidase (prepilin peptidase)/N-methyltransferase
VLVGLLGALLGVVLGPFLAGLTLSVPAGDPVLGKWWWRGGEAGRRRVVVVTGLAAVALGAVAGTVGAEPELPAYLWLAAVGVTLAVIDIETLRLPDRLTLPSYPVGLVLLAIPADWPALRRAVLAAAVTGAAAFLLALLAPRGGLGFGDVKLLGVGVAAGFTLGAVAALAMLASRRAGLRDHLAFGPWLIAGALVGVVAGRPLVDAYLSVGA